MGPSDHVDAFSIVDFALDVSDAVPVDEKCVVTGTLFVPDELDERPTVVVAVPGASYNQKYWDLGPPIGTNYSQARYFARRGIIFAAMDYLGGGDSSRPAKGESLTLPVLAAAAHQAVVGLSEGLRTGALLTRRIEPFRLVGAGHSFGAAITILQQALHEDFEAIAVMGYSAIESGAVQDVPENWDDLPVEEKRAIVAEGLAKRFGGDYPVYHRIARSAAWRALYPEDATDALVAYDNEALHTTVPRVAGIDAMTPRFALPYAAKVTVPVFLAFGDRDTCDRPHREPRAYSACPDLTLTTYGNMRHLHNFAESRTSLWERSAAWLDYTSATGVSAAPPSSPSASA